MSPSSGSGWSRRASLGFAVFATILLTIPNWMLHRGPTSLAVVHSDRDRSVLAQLRFLGYAIEHGAADDMQELYPEGFFFLHVLHGLAWSELALGTSDAPWKDRALEESMRSLAVLESPAGRAVFQPEIDPPLGVAYVGWTCFLRERILQLQGEHPDSALMARTVDDLDRLARLYDTSASPFQQSYRGMVWPGDNVVPLAAMGLHDSLHGDQRYANTLHRWVVRARSLLETETGMPSFELSHPSGEVVHPVRGSGQTLLLRFLPFVDPVFAREQYERFREVFLERRLGLVLVREFPVGQAGDADYDSGPVVWDIGASATIVSVGTTRQYGDTVVAGALERSVDFYGLPYEHDGMRRYALGWMPVADAFLAWSKVAIPDPRLAISREPILTPFWFLPIHLVSLLLAGLCWVPWVFLRRRFPPG
ncbi:MAG: hypothetical protein H6686_11215 [Fibrobacteria bacterium]|nr:hypothetical protein [Fibrobacteria bacterium]